MNNARRGVGVGRAARCAACESNPLSCFHNTRELNIRKKRVGGGGQVCGEGKQLLFIL
jgi:hypothetical protein